MTQVTCLYTRPCPNKLLQTEYKYLEINFNAKLITWLDIKKSPAPTITIKRKWRQRNLWIPVFEKVTPRKSNDLNDREYSDYYHFRIRWEKSRSKLALQIKFNLARNIITTVKFVQDWWSSPLSPGPTDTNQLSGHKNLSGGWLQCISRDKRFWHVGAMLSSLVKSIQIGKDLNRWHLADAG